VSPPDLPAPTPKIQKHREPGDGEVTCDKCSGTGRVDNHVCTKCWGSGVMNEDGTPIKPGDG
jgi:DnaJ-class molecular chaperone